MATWLCVAGLSAQSSSIDVALAARYFEEMRNLGDKDGGQLWGIQLAGPMILGDPGTRTVVANQADPSGRLTRHGNVFVGQLPDDKTMANTAIEWEGVRWTMLVWPLPVDSNNRARLMAHESFHRIQNEIGLPLSNPSNAHLNSLEGRLWLRLEWRALRHALLASGKPRRDAIADALLFRSIRQSLFDKAKEDERLLEMNEGLAEYTGFKLCGLSDSATADYASVQLERYEDRDSYVRSFAYASGPAYGLLLDAAKPDWRKNLRASGDFGRLMQQAYPTSTYTTSVDNATRQAAKYGYDSVLQSETERDELQKKRIAEYKTTLMDGPILIIPLQQASGTFNPNAVQPMEPFGTVYPTARFTDSWGVLSVTGGGVLVNPDWTKLHVPAFNFSPDVPFEGVGWKLELHDGWKIIPAERPGDWIVSEVGRE